MPIELRSTDRQKGEKENKISLKEQDEQNREIHKYMNKILNEKIKKANKIITGIQQDPDYVFEELHMEKRKKKWQNRHELF